MEELHNALQFIQFETDNFTKTYLSDKAARQIIDIFMQHGWSNDEK